MKNKEKKIGILVMVTQTEKQDIETRAKENGFNSVSEYIRIMALRGEVSIQ